MSEPKYRLRCDGNIVDGQLTQTFDTWEQAAAAAVGSGWATWASDAKNELKLQPGWAIEAVKP